MIPLQQTNTYRMATVYLLKCPNFDRHELRHGSLEVNNFLVVRAEQPIVTSFKVYVEGRGGPGIEDCFPRRAPCLLGFFSSSPYPFEEDDILA